MSMEWMNECVDGCSLRSCLRHDYLQYAEGKTILPRH
jgi:hypothetical protein